MPRFGLITRIALLVLGVEAAAFGALGWFYVDRFSRAAEENIQSRLQVVGRMIANEDLSISVVTRASLMSELVGAPFRDGYAIGGNGRVIVANQTALLGRRAENVPGFDPGWQTPEAPEIRFIEAPGIITGVMRLRGPAASTPLYTTVVSLSTAPLEARKQAIVLWGVAGSLVFMVLSSAAIVFIAQRLITRRVARSLMVLKRVEDGDIDARIPLSTADELGELQRGINSMTEKLGALLRQHRHNEEEIRATSRLLDSIVENIPNMIFLKRADDLRFVLFNKAGERLLGFDRSELLGRNDHDFFPPEQADAFTARDREILNSQEAVLDIPEETIDTRYGQRVLHTKKLALRDAGGRPAFLLGISEDITERKRDAEELMRHRDHLEELVATRTADLVQAKIAAEAANRAKSVFLANMSHELRTPLNAILGFARLMERDERIPEEQRHNIATINRSGNHLLSLINDVLEISRIEAGRTTVANEPFDLPSTLTAVEEMTRVRAEAKGLAFSVERPAGLPAHVLGDAHHLRQVLINLLGNAVKYTEHGRVELRVTLEDGDRIHFQVRDTGPGIAPEEQQRIFQAFYQTDVGVAKGEGTGLGLTISQEFVRLMGGEITVDSTPGLGSVFAFTIPLPPTLAQPGGDSVARVVGLAEGQPAPRVLVAEDNPDNQQVVEQTLRQVGFQVRIAANGREAVELFQSWRPHFIFMDMRMPVMDGYAATRAIRTLPGGRDIPIVALTASAFEEDRGQVLQAGCDDMVRKPIEEQRLFEVIGQLLDLRYRHADPDPSQPPGAAAPAEHLGELAAGLRAALGRAAVALDKDATLAIVEELRPTHPAEAALIAGLVDSYRFDTLESLCRQAPAGLDEDRLQPGQP